MTVPCININVNINKGIAVTALYLGSCIENTNDKFNNLKILNEETYFSDKSYIGIFIIIWNSFSFFIFKAAGR